MNKNVLFLVAIMVLTIFSNLSYGAKQINYCVTADVQTLDPHASAAVVTYLQTTQIYDPLIQYNHTTKSFDPMLATNWTVSADGLTYTFALRKGVKWQSNDIFKPTRDFNADDVVFTVKSQMDEKSPYHYAGNTVSMSVVGWNSLIDDVVALDNYTVQFKLKRPMSTFLLTTTYGAALIQSKEYADTVLKKGDLMLMHKKPLGTGAFSFAGYEQDNYLRMTANKDYWGNKAKVDRLTFLVVKDSSILIDKIDKGECDFADNVKVHDILEAEQKGGSIGRLVNPIVTIYSLGLNTKHDVLNKKEVREALAYAIDYDRILKDVFYGQAVRANSTVPQNIAGFDPTVEAYKYDPKKARDILLKAGVKPNTIKLNFFVSSAREVMNPTAEIVQANLKDIGIDVTVSNYEWGTLIKNAYKNGEHDLIVNGWSAYQPDPYSYLALQFSCSAAGMLNPSMYCNKNFDNLTSQAVVLNDQSKRNVLYGKAQHILVRDDVGQIPLAITRTYTVYNKNRVKITNNDLPYYLPYLNNYDLSDK